MCPKGNAGVSTNHMIVAGYICILAFVYSKPTMRVRSLCEETARAHGNRKASVQRTFNTFFCKQPFVNKNHRPGNISRSRRGV